MPYYHISPRDDLQELIPYIPYTLMEEEDNTTKRVCVSDSVQGCVQAIQNAHGDSYHVYVVMDSRPRAIVPSVSQVPDRDETGEVWILEKVRIKKVGKITTGLRPEYDCNRDMYVYEYYTSVQ